MKILEGQKFKIKHDRKGVIEVFALEDFDTEEVEFYPVATCNYVEGLANEWEQGEVIPCRKSLCKIILDK